MKKARLILLSGIFITSIFSAFQANAQIKNSFYDRVGIGIDDPQEPLHMIGNAIISGKIFEATAVESTDNFYILLDRYDNNMNNSFSLIASNGTTLFQSNEDGHSNFTGDVDVDESLLIGGAGSTTNHVLEVQGENSTTAALSVESNYTGLTTTARAAEFLGNGGNGVGVGVYSEGGDAAVYGVNDGGASSSVTAGGQFYSSGTAGIRYGLFGRAEGNTGSIKIGVYGYAGSGTGTTSYGVYGFATGATRNYAIYGSGDLKVTSQVFIGTSTTDEDNGAGYELLVDGQALLEEVKVEISGNWPDYVFEPNYDRLSLNELETYVMQNKHLPGIPSAQQVTEEGGHNLGQTQRQLLEKIEELTLYLIEVNQEKEQLQLQLEQLTKRVETLEQK